MSNDGNIPEQRVVRLTRAILCFSILNSKVYEILRQLTNNLVQKSSNKTVHTFVLLCRYASVVLSLNRGSIAPACEC